MVLDPKGFIDRMIGRARLLFLEKQNVYCQNCNDNLTNTGALINEKGEACCNSYLPCLEKKLCNEKNKTPFESDFYNPMDLQSAIREKILLFYTSINSKG